MANVQIDVLYRTNKGISQVGLDTELFNKRKIFITGDVTTQTMFDAVKKMMYLIDEDPEEEINIYINSPGGEVNSGLMFYDYMQSVKTPVNMYCLGMAASMGAVILAGGQQGRRFILPHSKVMIHEPLIAGGVGGSATSIKNTAESILETKAIINGLLAKHTGKSVDEIDKATSFDNFMNAAEAVEFGIVDEVRNIT